MFTFVKFINAINNTKYRIPPLFSSKITTSYTNSHIFLLENTSTRYDFLILVS